MPITDTNVIDGPNVQDNGDYRGEMEFIFDDGRRIVRAVNAADAAAWANLIVDMPALIEDAIEEKDANEASEVDQEITAYKQASIKRVALAFLRRAYSTGDPYRAYLKFSRFNDYRLAQGWTLNQVVENLSEVGLTDDEWTDMRDRYQYLSQADRVTAMSAFQAVLDGDIWGEINR